MAPEAPSHRINHRIRISPIRVIDEDGTALGIMSADEGRTAASERNLDLVEVSPNVRPPVCRIMDYGKYRYEQSKKKAANRSARVSIKTVQLRPKTDDHDLQTKLRKAEEFLADGNPVRLVMRMRGRERAYTERWVSALNEVIEGIDHEIVVKAPSRPEGRSITALVEPVGANA